VGFRNFGGVIILAVSSVRFIRSDGSVMQYTAL